MQFWGENMKFGGAEAGWGGGGAWGQRSNTLKPVWTVSPWRPKNLFVRKSAEEQGG